MSTIKVKVTTRQYRSELRGKDGRLIPFVEGGKKAAKRNKELYGDDFYQKIGSMGGKISRGGGFAANPELARIAGAKGGTNSRKRGKNGTTRTN